MAETKTSFSRRDFLKTLGIISLAGIAVATDLDQKLPLSTPDQKNNNLNQPKHPELLDSAETTADSIIKEVYQIYSLEIIMPDIMPNGEPNIPWNTIQLSILQEVLTETPPITLFSPHFPKQIHLYKSSIQPGINGFLNGTGYADQNIDIIMTTLFDDKLENTGTEKIFFETQKNLLKAIFLHETTHSLTEAYPEILNSWQDLTGWVQNPDGAWANYHLEQIIPLANSSLYPWEDIAVALSVFAINPNYLLRISEPRHNFFLNSPYFQNWEVAIKRKKSLYL